MRGLFILIVLVPWSCSELALGARPLIINDAEPLEKGRVQLEAGGGYVRHHGADCYELPFALTYGASERIEVGVGFGGRFEDVEHENGATAFERGLGEVSIGFKWKLVDAEQAIFDQAISGAVLFPTQDDGGPGSAQTDYALSYILTRAVDEKLTALFNIGYTFVGADDESDVLHYGPAVQYQLTERWQPVAEVVFETPVEGGKTSAGANAGVRYQLTESIVLDVAMGVRVAGEWPDWTATAGVTWVF